MVIAVFYNFKVSAFSQFKIIYCKAGKFELNNCFFF